MRTYFSCVNANARVADKFLFAVVNSAQGAPLRLATLRFEFPCPSSVQTIPTHWRCLQPLSKTYCRASGAVWKAFYGY